MYTISEKNIENLQFTNKLKCIENVSLIAYMSSLHLSHEVVG